MSLVTALGVLAAIGLLFVMDPGGAIAESGFSEFQEMGFKQLAVWGFRTIGIVVAQLIIIVLWFWPKWRPPRASTWHSASTLPSSMPAAAVSVLQGHMIWNPTTPASIVEMCQRGTLRIEAVGTDVGFLYRLSLRGPTQYGWERTICDSLPSRPTTIDALDEALKQHEDSIGDQIGDYLQQHGLYHDNPVRVRRENDGDSAGWGLLAGALMGVGSGLLAALWLDQWWANVLIGAFIGLVYMGMAPTIRTGMAPPTDRGTLEISQWLGWMEAMAASGPMGARDHSDTTLPYAVALNVAQPWLDLAASAPPWFGSGSASSLRGTDLDAAYRAFMHAPEWWLNGRSNDAAKDAAEWGYEVELEALQLDPPDPGRAEHRRADEEEPDMIRDQDSWQSATTDTARASSSAYQPRRMEGAIGEEKGGGCLRGCFLWVLGLGAVGALVMVVLFSLDVVSPREKPCPLDSPPIPTPAQIATVGDLLRDECVRVRGTVVFQDADELVLEMDRGEFVQRVIVRDLSEALEAIPEGRVVTLAARLLVEENGTYEVHFVPEYGSDQGWWRNLRENLSGLF